MHPLYQCSPSRLRHASLTEFSLCATFPYDKSSAAPYDAAVGIHDKTKLVYDRRMCDILEREQTVLPPTTLSNRAVTRIVCLTSFPPDLSIATRIVGDIIVCNHPPPPPFSFTPIDFKIY